ncbi:MAG: InlB B-repeat-containing protein, partial [Lachnospiraceae bacterium]|nr:InlB B-repeat-containing protein [Lachnospiraceae bacterium]
EMGSGLRSSLYGWIDNMVYDAYAGGSDVYVYFKPRGGLIVSGDYEYTTYDEGLNIQDFSSYSLPYASKPGYHFDGWYGLDSAPAENAPHPSVTPYPMAISGSAIEESQTLYAFYTPLRYEISYNDGNPDYTIPSARYYTYGESTAIGDASKEGMKFLGWSTDPSGNVKLKDNIIPADTIGPTEYQENPADNEACILPLYAFFTPLDSYSITYKRIGGIEQTALPETYYAETETVIPEVSKTGYEFNGWSTDEAGAQKSTNYKITASQTGDITLYANFTAKTYSVTYEKISETEASALPKAYTYEKEQIIPEVTRTGYVFNGWSTDEAGAQKLTGNKIPETQTGDITLYANFTAKTYSITYEKISETEASALPTAYTYGKEQIIPKVTRTGYEFNGWSTDEAGTQKLKENKIPETQTEDITLYAIFSPVAPAAVTTYVAISEPTPSPKPEVVVSFAPGEGTGTMESMTTVKGSLVLPECTFTAPDNMFFDGWGDSRLQPGEQYSTDTNTTLTAQWRTLKVSVTAPEFDAVPAVYSQPDFKKIVIANDEAKEITITEVTLSGEDAAAFKLNKTAGTAISAGRKDESYTIRPVAGLLPGTAYKADITVKCSGVSVTAEVSFEVEDYDPVDIPEVSTPGGTYDKGKVVALSCDTKDASIYYTTDGSNPLSSNTRKLYESEFAIRESLTLKAAAVKDNLIDSEIMSETYNITGEAGSDNLLFDVASVTLNSGYSIGGPINVTVSKGVNPESDQSDFVGKVLVKAANDEVDGMLYVKRTTDTTIPMGCSGIPYSIFVKPGLEAGTHLFTVYFRTSDGKEYLKTSYRVVVQNIKDPEKNKAKVPALTLKPGTYNGPQEVKIEDFSSSSPVYYTTDGSDPSSSETRKRYTGSPIKIRKTTTLKFIVEEPGAAYSDVLTADYTIKTHKHSWRYSVSGNTITRTCTNKDGLHVGNVTSSLTINKPAIAAGDDDGSEEAVLTGDMNVSAKVIYKNGDTILDNAPIEPGTYTASVTVAGKTASVEYKLDKYYLTPATFELEEKYAYFDGNVHDVKVKKVKLYGKSLTLDEDYTIAVVDGKTVKEAGNYQVILKGKGKYSGTTRMSLRYSVLRKQKSIATVKARDIDIYKDETAVHLYRFNNDKGIIGLENAAGNVTYTVMKANCFWHNGNQYDIRDHISYDSDTGAFFLEQSGSDYFYDGQVITVTYLIRDEGNDNYSPANFKVTVRYTVH